MCGLVGIMDTRGKAEVSRSLLDKMNETQHHRGPDEGGLHLGAGIGLGHRRLSIIDLSSGQQPLYNEDGSVVVSYNGEIYNFQALAAELTALGHTFRTHCDTEVIVHAWEQWGEACVERFRGMFAFAVWDDNRQTLFLARDRLGIKPLHYALLDDATLIVGSELKALTAHPQLKRELDPYAVEEYFGFGYVPEPRTIYKQARKLPPAHTLTVRRGERVPEPRAYWDVQFAPAEADEAEAREELIERLREAVDIRMIAEVPLGAFLSGGVDSSAVVAMMAGLSDDPVNTCSISFGDPAFNEAAYAEKVAQRYGTRHRVEEVSPDNFSLVDRLAGLYDEPYADSSAMPTYEVCRLARKDVTVALSGDGGDENLAGYRRYRFHQQEERLRNMLPLGLRRPLFGALAQVYPKADWAPRVFRAKATFQAFARDTVEGYFHNISILNDAQRQGLYSDAFRRELQGYHAAEVLRRHDRNAPKSDPISRVQYLDLKTYLPGDILTKVDRASMAHSLEVRVPILDHPLVEWMARLPSSMKLKGGEGKHVFKRALEPHLPDDVLYRQKMGFAVPLASWFRGPLRERVREVVTSPAMMDSGLFDPAFLQRAVDQHQSGRRDNSAMLWSLLMFEAFVRGETADTAGAAGAAMSTGREALA